MFCSTVTSVVAAAIMMGLATAAITLVSQTDIDRFLSNHNNYRRSMPAVSMPDLVWNPEVAAAAQAWTDLCNFDHEHSQYGENLAAGTGRNNNFAAIDMATSQWISEEKYNVHGNYSCCRAPDYRCCHLTQVIWADSTQLGCGITFCPVMTSSLFPPWENAVYVACYYNPPGNYPRPPYTPK